MSAPSKALGVTAAVALWTVTGCGLIAGLEGFTSLDTAQQMGASGSGADVTGSGGEGADGGGTGGMATLDGVAGGSPQMGGIGGAPVADPTVGGQPTDPMLVPMTGGEGGTGGEMGTSTPIVDRPDPPDDLVVSPPGPTNENDVLVAGDVSQPGRVRVYTTASCSAASLVAEGDAEEFAAGLEVRVADDTTTTFYATVTNDEGGTSDCSTDSVTYEEDSSGPTPGAVSVGGPYQTSLTTIEGSWSGFSDSNGVSSYEYNVSTSTDCAGDLVLDTAAGGDTAVTVTGLALVNHATYFLCVRATDGIGNVGAYEASDGVTINATPTGLLANALSPRAVRLQWSYPHPEASPDDGVAIVRTDDVQGHRVVVGSVPVDQQSFTDDRAVQPNTAYTYELYVYGSLFSKLSDPAQVTTPALAVFAPASVSALDAQAQSWAVVLSWVDDSLDEEGFRISRSTNGVDFEELALLAPDTTEYRDHEAIESTQYTYRVEAFNDAGMAPATTSNAVSVPALDATALTGALTSPTTLAPGNYLVTGSGVSIAPGSTLTLTSGVVIRFAPGATLQVRGSLVIDGSTAVPVRLDSASPRTTNWGGIDVRNDDDGASATIRHANVSHANTGLRVQGGNNGGPVTFYDTEIHHGSVGLDGYAGWRLTATRTDFHHLQFVENAADRAYSYCTVRNNGAGMNDGRADFLYSVFLDNADFGVSPGDATVIGCFASGNGIGVRTEFNGFLVERNTIVGNDDGILLGNCCSNVVSGTITENNVYGNTSYAIRHSKSGSVSAANNWWATTDSAALEALVYDFIDDIDVGSVNPDPPLSAPVDGIPDLPSYP